MSFIAPGAPKRKEEESDRRAFQERNRFVLFSVSAFLVGLLTALYLGAVAQADFEDVPGWMTAIASVLATGISLIAVYLVSQTLLATRETLGLTQEMTRDQRRIGEAQIRPFIMFDSEDHHIFDDRPDTRLVLQNFGNTPAADLTVSVYLEIVTYIEDETEEGQHSKAEVADFIGRLKYVPAVPPGGRVLVDYEAPCEVSGPGIQLVVSFTWKYWSHDRQNDFEGEHHMSIPESHDGRKPI